MENSLNITAVNGWALPVDWFHEQVSKAFPDSNIRVICPENPSDTHEAEILLGSLPADLYIGYSLGSLWLLLNRKLLPQKAIKALLAPILAFSRERQMGGKTSETQLKFLIRILEKNPENKSPLVNFFSNCEVPFPDSLLNKVSHREVLIKGLNFLLNIWVPGNSTDDFMAIVGENDIFLDPVKLKMQIPNLEVVGNSGHAPQSLLDCLAKRIFNGSLDKII